MALIIGRDAALVAGGFVHRFHKVGWRWPGAAEFFRLSASSPSADAASQMQSAGAASSSSAPSTANLIHSTSQQPSSSSSSNAGQENAGKHRKGQAPNSKSSTSVDASIAAISDIGTSKSQQQKPQEQQPQQKDAANAKLKAASEGQSTEPAAFVQPLYISKVNTCFQLLLVGGCLTSSWYAWPPQEVLFGLGVVTGGTTVASSAAYARAYLQGKIK